MQTAEAERSLHFFVRLMWPVLEPATKFADGWWPRAWCEHLEAVTNGDITRLIGNCPPGSCKSLLTSVFWPAWVWGPRRKPWTRFLCAAYSQTLTERDNDRMRLLVQSPEYQARWGSVFKASDSKINFQNDKTGWKVASSVGGTITGMRGDIFLCFPPGELVQTGMGPVPIERIVANGAPFRLPSFNEASGLVEHRRVIGWHRNPGAEIVRLTLASGAVVRCTADHRIWLGPGRWEAASNIPMGAALWTFDRDHVAGGATPDAAAPDVVDDAASNAVGFGKDERCVSRDKDRADLASGKFGERMCLPFGEITNVRKGAVFSRLSDVLGSGAVAKIGRSGIPGKAILMPDLLASGTWTEKRRRDHSMNPAMSGLAAGPDIKAGVTTSIPGGLDDLLAPNHGKTSSHDRSCMASDAAKIGNGVVLKAWDGKPSLDYVVDITHEGYSPVTYCLTVEGNHNLFIGDGIKIILAANCDDPNNINESESRVVRDNTNRWLAEVMPTRLNNLEKSAIVLIQQRTHEEDATGFLLRPERGGDRWAYVMVPMTYDPDWTCGQTPIGWRDPRTERGDLFWPARFSPQSVADLKNEMTDYAWAGQMQQHPEPRGGAIIKRDWWKLYGREDEDPLVVKLRFPAFSYLVASLDCALTDKAENDPSALIVLGLWTVPHTGQQAVMLVNAWQDRLQINPLVKRVAETCDKYRVDALLIENKANGHSVQQEIKRMYQRADWSTQLVDPTMHGEKIARVHSITHLFEEGLIWRPNTEWAEMVIDQCAVFPRGSHDDLVDALSQCLRFLRERGILYRRQEARWHEQDIAALARGQVVPKPLYSA